jgi:hypothetical protein
MACPLPRGRAWSAIGSRHTAHCRALVAHLAAAGCGGLSTRLDRDYPRRWTERADPAPPFAYLYGAPELLACPSVALLNVAHGRRC